MIWHTLGQTESFQHEFALAHLKDGFVNEFVVFEDLGHLPSLPGVTLATDVSGLIPLRNVPLDVRRTKAHVVCFAARLKNVMPQLYHCPAIEIGVGRMS